MSNPNKAKGTTWETLVAGYLNEYGLNAERTGSADMDLADIHAGEWVIEAKAQQAIDLPGYLKQLAKSVQRRDSAPYKSVVMVKNRRHSVQDGYAVMSIENYRSLMLYVNALEGTLAEVADSLLEAQNVSAN